MKLDFLIEGAAKVLTTTNFDLPETLLLRARDFAQAHHTTLTALIIEQLEAVIDYKDDDPLLRFSRGLITKEQAVSESGLHDYAELLVAMGDADLPLPSLPQEEIDRQAKEFAELWKGP